MAYLFISPKFRNYPKLSLITLGLTLIVILLGAYTRLTNAGLSCPDWPHCYGFITAPHTQTQLQNAAALFPAYPVETKKAWTEMVHRYFAGTAGLFMLGLAGTILFNRKAKDSKSKWLALCVIALVGTQVMLGALTVTAQLKPLIVTLHLLTGITLLSLIWWIYLDMHLQDDSFIQKQKTYFRPFLWLGLILLILQITLGGWVSSHYAGLACIDLPYCNGSLVPALNLYAWDTDLITIHMLHRFGAIITGSYLVLLACALLRNKNFRSLAALLLLLTGSQIALGILNILWFRPVWIALLHHGVALLLLLVLITAIAKNKFMLSTRFGLLHA